MSTRHMSGKEQLARILLALALIGFSWHEHTLLMKAVAGYLVTGYLLMSVVAARYATWITSAPATPHAGNPK